MRGARAEGEAVDGAFGERRHDVAEWHDSRPAATPWAPTRGWPAVTRPIPSGANRAAQLLALGCGLFLGMGLASVATGICLALLLRTTGPASAAGGGAKWAGITPRGNRIM